MSRTFETIIYENVEDGIVRVTMNRPEKLNAINMPMLHEIHEALDAAEADKDCVVIIFRGAGDNFTAGRDFKYSGDMAKSDPRGWDAWRQEWHGPHNRLWRSNLISIAEIRGYALGGGHTLGLGSDMTICAEDAKFGYNDTRFGMAVLVNPDFWIEWLGHKKAKEIMLTGYMLDAEDAYYHNLVNRVVPSDILEEEVLILAQDVVTQERHHPGQAATIKFQINRQSMQTLMALDEYVYQGCQTEREFIRKMPDVQQQYFDLAAEKGAKAMITKMREGFHRHTARRN